MNAAPTTPRRTARPQLVPHQHGAWGFLALPVVLGVVAGGWSWALVPLVVAWVAAYPLSWALTGVLTMRRPERFHRALIVWGAIALPAGLVSLALRPWLGWVALGYLALFAVSLGFARARNERALANDLILIAQCTGMVAVIVGVATGERGWTLPHDTMLAAPAVVMKLVCFLTLVGSTLHVKSLIRERNDPRYTAASQAFALVCVPLVLGAALLADLSSWLAGPFVVLAARALFWHDPSWRPARIGMVELGALVLVAAGSAVALG